MTLGDQGALMEYLGGGCDCLGRLEASSVQRCEMAANQYNSTWKTNLSYCSGCHTHLLSFLQHSFDGRLRIDVICARESGRSGQRHV